MTHIGDRPSPEMYATMDGVRCRAWEGRTPLGSACLVYVAWVDIPHGQDTREFDVPGTEDGEAPMIEVEASCKPDFSAGTWTVEPAPESPGLVRALASILPLGNPARGGKRDEEEDDEGSK